MEPVQLLEINYSWMRILHYSKKAKHVRCRENVHSGNFLRVIDLMVPTETHNCVITNDIDFYASLGFAPAHRRDSNIAVELGVETCAATSDRGVFPLRLAV